MHAYDSHYSQGTWSIMIYFMHVQDACKFVYMTFYKIETILFSVKDCILGMRDQWHIQDFR